MDGTLITLKNKPNYPVIDMFRMFQKLGWDMNIHSGSGVDYARMWKEKLGLMASVKMKGDPNEEYDIAVDDSLDEYDWTHIKHKNYIKAKVFITI